MAPLRRPLSGLPRLLACVLPFAACSSPPAPAPTPAMPAVGAPTDDPPWLIRRTMPGGDGRPVEVLGAPGPRAVAAVLSLAMRRVGVQRVEEVGDPLTHVPGFYHFRFDGVQWRVVGRPLLHPFVELRSSDGELLRREEHEELFAAFAIDDLAIAMNDVIWKWPMGTERELWYLRAPVSPERVGENLARLLRERLDAGTPLSWAWQELQFLDQGQPYRLELLGDARMRVSWARPSQWHWAEPWEGRY